MDSSAGSAGFRGRRHVRQVAPRRRIRGRLWSNSPGTHRRPGEAPGKPQANVACDRFDVDDQRLGTVLRQIRIRRRLRQADVARLAGSSQPTVSRIERGHLRSLTFEVVRSVAAALDVRVDTLPRWRAGDLDRLLNSHHAQLHEQVARRFATLPGWTFRPEVSFAIYAERGVIDILAFHGLRQVVLVIELKTDIADVNELVGTLDRKRRLAIDIARDQGWNPGPTTCVGVWLIVAASRTNRRRLMEHRAMLRAAFPTDGRSMRGWLLAPSGPVRAVSMWPRSRPGTTGPDLRSVRRIGRAGKRPPEVAASGRHP
jgi:transcriptional regulator with XRE-family HTH domain